MTTEQNLNQTFQALADPTRRAIMARLAEGESSVNELAAPFDISLPAVSRHLKVLEEAKLIERRKDAQFRPCRLKPENLQAAAAWINHYKRFWEGQFDQLATYLEDVNEELQTKGDKEDG